MSDSKTCPSGNLYPLPSREHLLNKYLNVELTSWSLPTPAAIIDRAIVRRNCDAMLNVCHALGVAFRAHVKSHKTIELSRMQVGDDDSRTAHFAVSTLIEAENLVPLANEYQARGRKCNILYAVPLPPSSLPRLHHLAARLPPNTISILLDNPTALTAFLSHPSASTASIGIFIKIDTGYARAGLSPSSPTFRSTLQDMVRRSGTSFTGLYSHYGHSYGGSGEDDALRGLLEELQGLENAAKYLPAEFQGSLVLSVGATPTATAAQNLFSSDSGSAKVAEVRQTLARLKNKGCEVELHAGVYPLLDLQQVATHARPAKIPPSQSSSSHNSSETPAFQPLSKSNIALRILAEVSSVYPERSPPEALINAGSLALGREPCRSYPGWGILSSCLELGSESSTTAPIYDEQGDREGWIVSRISQEHGILAWQGESERFREVQVGDRVAVWPNHACVAGAGFGWYYVVDSQETEETGKEKVVDVWVRWRGW
ncbi:uncharacterized protein EI97DRAFT_436913 [Westerdykella ornata]|uniref:D-serine dehydratase n=1 Tax=Westerdykella ornata TaxID=318751 RepID=A0A6A6J8T4_WESOR|nr:uncharacterized protein EI97DRAFT_436913 [Westerdykella ornata]KAF2272418.1 hypothetical protein EI97DRAFT_436913 [Westerdykella ornata]